MINKTFISEIAGKDSIAAISSFINDVDCKIKIVPTIVYTGTEYGKFESYKESIHYLKTIANNHVAFDKIYELRNEKIWNTLIYKYQFLLNKKYNFFTPCIMCHFYTHLLRIPLYVEKKATGLITGERMMHDDKIKLNQHFLVLECFHKLFSSYDINIIQPILQIKKTKIIDSYIDDRYILEGANDVRCILSDNLTGFIIDDKRNVDRIRDFLNEFVEPIGHYCINEMLEKGEIDVFDLDFIIKENIYG